MRSSVLFYKAFARGTRDSIVPRYSAHISSRCRAIRRRSFSPEKTLRVFSSSGSIVVRKQIAARSCSRENHRDFRAGNVNESQFAFTPSSVGGISRIYSPELFMPGARTVAVYHPRRITRNPIPREIRTAISKKLARWTRPFLAPLPSLAFHLINSVQGNFTAHNFALHDASNGPRRALSRTPLPRSYNSPCRGCKKNNGPLLVLANVVSAVPLFFPRVKRRRRAISLDGNDCRIAPRLYHRVIAIQRRPFIIPRAGRKGRNHGELLKFVARARALW